MSYKASVPIGTGGKKPSEAYEHLKALCSAHMPESRIMTMWVNQLPLELQLVITALRHQGKDRLMVVADTMMEIYEAQTRKPNVHELLLKQRIDALSEKVEELNDALAKLTKSKKVAQPIPMNITDML